MWALELYLEHVSTFRGSWRCLLVNPGPTATKELSADHITEWVHSVVTDAHASAEGVALPQCKIHAHEMPALASS